MDSYIPIPGFGSFEINTIGCVRRKVFDHFNNKQQVSVRLDNDGYPIIKIFDDNGKQKLCRIHRLVAITFIPNPKNLETVNHIDGNKLNNSADNLEWMSRQENVSLARKSTLNPRPNKKLSISQVKEIKRLWETGGFTQKQLAKDLKINVVSIHQIVRNKIWKSI